ncbi:hypothetical protein H5410_036085 [Solanum commersonii]|uniref:DUF7746 domain-containing protein n=1 Tax=Solanum commersonii TaxID=4109 RepID=A0A9J5Y3R0_SOLCO|nr:hypothetical protein H5410_036085 [Solanum commersonii]
MNFKNETILIETNFSKSKVITRRPIKWDEIDFSKEWVIKEALPSKNNINSDIEQTPDGTVKIKFTDQNLLMSYADNISFPSRMLRSNSSYISPVDYIDDMSSRASTSHIREDNSRVSTYYMKEGKRVDNIKNENHIVTHDMDPTLSEMDFPSDNRTVYFTTFTELFDDNDTALITSKHVKTLIQQNNYTNVYVSILGEHIFFLHDKISHLCSELKKFKIPDKGKEKATPTIQPLQKLRTLNYHSLIILKDCFKKDEINKISEKHTRKSVQRITICKINKNSEKDTANMIIAKFTVQLKGWWDNYLSESQRMAILNAVKDENGMTPNIVYTLILTIIEHFFWKMAG